MGERVTASGTTPTVWNSFTWNGAPWGGVTANALPTFTDYITIDGQVVAQRKITYPLASAWGLQTWNGFTWGAPAGSLWGSNAASNPPRFKWGTDPWSGNVVGWNYFVLDHLGSVAVITDQGGNVLQRLSFDAWGKARSPGGTAQACGTVTASTTRGFTNQEQMPTQCLVNLNARLYDASIGKFMAADTIVPDPFNGQAYNRYAYVNNNPLSFTDVTGHIPTESIVVSGTRIYDDPGPTVVHDNRGPTFTGFSPLLSSTIEGDADPASEPANTARPISTLAQQNQNSNGAKKARTPRLLPNTCSRAGGTACAGSYWTGWDVARNASGPGTDADNNAQGTNGTNCPGCEKVAMGALVLCVGGPAPCAVGAGITAGQVIVGGAIVGGAVTVGGAIILHNEQGGDTADRPPTGSKPIDSTPWSGDHQEIKEGIGAGPTDSVRISKTGDVWGQNPNGTWTNHGPASDYTGSGRPSGQRGKDRDRN